MIGHKSTEKVGSAYIKSKPINISKELKHSDK